MASAPPVVGRPAAPSHLKRAPALDLKQATAAVFYALARGWLSVKGLGPEEEQTEHIQSEGTGNKVLVRETERSRAMISTSITEHVRCASSAVRDSYPAGGVTWQKILDHLTKSGRGKFESTHRGKVTAGSWRRYELKPCTELHELLCWVQKIVSHVPSVSLELQSPPEVSLPVDASVSHAIGVADWSGEMEALAPQEPTSALDDEVRAHARTKRQLEAAVARNVELELRVQELKQEIANSQQRMQSTLPNTLTSLGSADASTNLQVPRPDVVSAPAPRGVKRRGPTQPREGPYGTRRLWRVVTPSGESRQRTAAVEFVEGSQGGLGAGRPPEPSDDTVQCEMVDLQIAGGDDDDILDTSLILDMDAGWAPTNLGPIQFA